jgi:hypothetical protein
MPINPVNSQEARSKEEQPYRECTIPSFEKDESSLAHHCSMTAVKTCADIMRDKPTDDRGGEEAEEEDNEDEESESS